MKTAVANKKLEEIISNVDKKGIDYKGIVDDLKELREAKGFSGVSIDPKIGCPSAFHPNFGRGNRWQADAHQIKSDWLAKPSFPRFRSNPSRKSLLTEKLPPLETS